jgi:hypothetical protein
MSGAHNRAAKPTHKPPLRKVVVVFKTHFDLGFTDLPQQVMASYTGPMFEAVRRVIQATSGGGRVPPYTWTLPAWPLKQLLHDPNLPEDTRRAAHELVEQGRLCWHVWPFTTHTALCGLEELVRGMHISRALSEEFGTWPAGAKQTDVPGHTWVFPMVLARAGVKFLHLGCNPGSHPPHVPPLFWWEGPDGSRILTWYSTGGYGSALTPPEDWHLDTWLAVQQTVDNTGPHTPQQLLAMVEHITAQAPGVQVVFGQLADFVESLLEHPEQLEDLPVVPYDLADTWIHGVGTMPREVARVRALRPALLAVETMAALLDWPPGSAYGHRTQAEAGAGTGAEGGGQRSTEALKDFPLARRVAQHIDHAYEQLMLFGEHTWGLDVKSTIRWDFEHFEQARQTEPYRRLESSWSAKAAYVDRAEQAFHSALRTVLEAWEQARGEGAGASAPEGEGEAGGETGRGEHPPAATAHTNGETATLSTETVLENKWLRLEVDPVAGGISSLLDKRTGHEWVDRAGGEPFGGYRYDIYSVADIGEFLRAYGQHLQDWFIHDFGKPGYPEDVPHITAYARNFRPLTTGRAERSGKAIRLVGGQLEPGFVGHVRLPDQRVTVNITLPDDVPCADLEYRIEGKVATPLAESAVVPLPLNLAKAAYRLGQVGSVIDPARDIVEGANRSLWCVDGWLDATDDRLGLAVIPLDMPLVSVGTTGIYSFDPARVPTGSVVYSHMFNTQWGTNFPQWLEGEFRFRIRLFPHAGDWRVAGVWRLARATFYPPAGLPLPPTLPVSASDGFLLQSIRPRHDGAGIILRYWDALGLPRQVEVELKGPVSKVWRCDLMERPTEELPVSPTGSGVRVPVKIAAHAIETLLVEF